MPPAVLDRLFHLYAEIAEVTWSHCAGACTLSPRYGCCHELFCLIAQRMAKEMGTDLPHTGHPTLPMMGPNGCTAPPHFRPVCSKHWCVDNPTGRPHPQPPPEVKQRYQELREEISHLECFLPMGLT